MKRTGFAKISLSAVVFSMLLVAFCIYILPVLSAGIDSVSLTSPGNATWTNGNNDTIEFQFNYTGENATASCELFIDDAGHGVNGSVLNATPTVIYANSSISEGARNWYVNCTNETIVQSAVRVLNVDRTNPAADFGTNPVSNYNSPSPNITFQLNCSDNFAVNTLQLWGNWTETWHANQTNITPTNNTSWSAQVTNIPDGTWKWGVYCNDSAGNNDWSDTNKTFTVDKTSPTITKDSPISTTYNQNWVWANATLNENGSWCGYSLNEASNVTMLNDSQTHWYKNVSSIPDGYKNITFSCNDTSGNMNSSSGYIYFTIDATPSTVTLNSPVDYYNASSNPINFNCTVYDDINISNVTLYGNWTGTWHANTTNSSGINNTAYNFSKTIQEGVNHVWNCYACDNSSNCAFATANRTFTVDTQAPTITIVSPANQTYSSASIDFNVSLNEAGSWCGFELNGGSNNTMTQKNTTYFNYTNSSVPEGFYNVKFWCNDSAVGNMGNSSTRYFTVDYAPSTTLNSPPDNVWQINNSVTFNCSATDNIQLKNVTLYGNWSGNWTSNGTAVTMIGTSNSTEFNRTISDGIYVWNCLAYDNSSGSGWADSNYTLKIDTSNSTISLTSPVNNGWASDGVVNFTYNVSDLSGIKNCSLWITNSTRGNWHLNNSNSTVVTNNNLNNITANGTLVQGNYTWTVQCYDILNHSVFATNYTLNVGNRSELIIENITWTLNPTPYAGQNLTINVTVKNMGTLNAANDTVLRFCFGKSSSPCLIYSNTSVTISNSSLAIGGSNTSSYYVALNDSSGNYYADAYADYFGNESEQNETNNTMTKIISTYLNLTILNITYNGASPAMPLPGTNVTINLSVKYDNGTSVPGLAFSGFTIYDTRGSERNKTSYLYQTDFSQNGSGIYTFNYTVPAKNTTTNKSEYGAHTIIFYTNDTSTSHEGNSTSGSYTLMAPSLSVKFNPDSDVNMDVSTSTTVGVEVANGGTAPIYNVTVIWTKSSALYATVTPTNMSCRYANLTNGSGWVSCGVITIASGTTAGNFTITLSSYFGNISPTDFYNGTADTQSISISVTAASNESEQENQQSSTCSSNSSCTANQYCSGGSCVALSCPSGYYASNHKCVLSTSNRSQMEIVTYEPEIYVFQGELKSTQVTVKNTGNIMFVAKLNATVNYTGNVSENVTAINITVSPYAVSIDSGRNYTFTVNFTVSNITEIGNYSGIFKAFDNANTSSYNTKTFVLTVLPTNETKSHINSTYYDYKKIFENITNEFNNINKNLVSEANYTKVNRTISAIKRLMDEIETLLINESGYIEANTLLTDVNTMLSQANSQMTDVKAELQKTAESQSGNLLVWIAGVIIVILIVVFLIYLLLPSGGYHPVRGYKPQKKPIQKQMKTGLEKFQEKIKTMPESSKRKGAPKFKPVYMPGYERRKSYWKGESLVDKIKNNLRKLKNK